MKCNMTTFKTKKPKPRLASNVNIAPLVYMGETSIKHNERLDVQ